MQGNKPVGSNDIQLQYRFEEQKCLSKSTLIIVSEDWNLSAYFHYCGFCNDIDNLKSVKQLTLYGMY